MANTGKRIFNMIDNYIVFYHLKNSNGQYERIAIPAYADSVQDIQPVSFASSTPLSRSAPIYSYQSSGPRTVLISLTLHRDLMYEINYDVSNVKFDNMNDDYVDLIIRYIQTAALPNYDAASKMVNPPMIGVRMGNDIFIKGIVLGSVGLTYSYPILDNGKYSNVTLSFTVAEVDPYSAEMIKNIGSFRAMASADL